MSFKTAIENLETAAQIAVEENDSYREHLALGLIEMAKAMRSDLHKIESTISDVKGKINSLR
jgi:hypothetical protein